MIEHLAIASCLCLGIYKTFQPGMIFHYLGYLIVNYTPTVLHKPLFKCPPCTASIWGTSYYLIYVGLDWNILLFVMCLAGLNFFTTQFFQE